MIMVSWGPSDQKNYYFNETYWLCFMLCSYDLDSDRTVPLIEAVDLFCGIGGLTYGLRTSNIRVKAGYDVDASCKYAYEKNNEGSKFILTDIKKLSGDDVSKEYSDKCFRVLVGCAPCQPFSTMNNNRGQPSQDGRWNLLDEFGRLVKEVSPDIVSMENVPRIKNTDVFKDFVNTLYKNNYNVDYKVVYCPNYGIPQSRRRLVLLASKMGTIKVPDGEYRNKKHITVDDTIGNLHPIAAGSASVSDGAHISSSLSDKNIDRIKKSIPGGSWKDWDDETLVSECHKKETGKSYGSVYSRMKGDCVSPTITTQFYRFGTGRFGHPTQDRALSLREGALLQTFPPTYKFFEDKKEFCLTAVGRHIGNAVPVKLGSAIGGTIVEHIKEEVQRHERIQTEN